MSATFRSRSRSSTVFQALLFIVIGVIVTPAITGIFSTDGDMVTVQSATATTPEEECVVSDILVNSCRPWLGARAMDYPDVPDTLRAQHEYHEARIDRNIDIAHVFAWPGRLPLASDDERYLAQREDTYLFQNWKPVDKWRDAGGDNATANAHIDRAADNMLAVAPTKIFLTIHHEPENDVTADSGCATKASASKGTAAEYRAMWHNVRSRFDAKGVDNVVWVMDYMNYSKWDCLVPKLYPGDDYVDWIMFNAYGAEWKPDFVQNVGRFYDLLTSLSNDERDLLAKPWGIVEWGIRDAAQEQARAYYAQAAQSLDDERFPKLKAYMIFDSPGTHDQGGLRIRYDDQGNTDLAEEQHYRDFANHPKLNDHHSCAF